MKPLPELTAFLEGLPEPHILFDAQYRILAANAAYRRQFSPERSVVGRRCYEVSHHFAVPCDQAGESCPLAQSRLSGQRERVLHLHHTRRGEEYVNIELSPLPGEDGQPAFFVEKMEPLRVAQGQPAAQGLIGRSHAFQRMLELIARVAPSDASVLLQGESGANAYYTLRSRLNQKIEEHLLQQMESPRTDILRKVANLNEVLFTKKRTITIATLKKLEKELLDYDLANELTIVYKSLKKIHINSPEHFQYSQLYNRHVAYMLAVNKAEDLMTEYFKKYGNCYLSNDETEKLGLSLLMKEMQNVARIYESHRLYVYQSCMLVFHRLFVEPDDNLHADGESIEDIFTHVQKIFDTYNLDPLYYHLNLIFEFLKLEYYNHYKVYRQVEKYFEEVNDAATNLLVNYSFYTFSARFLITKLDRHLRLATEKEIYTENESLFEDIESDLQDVPKHTIFIIYRALGCYYVGRYEEAAKLINGGRAGRAASRWRTPGPR